MPLSQVQQQKLTQEQIQLQTAMQVLSSKLVELPLDGLRERVEKELYENPYLETSNSDGGDGYIQDEGGGDSTYGSDYDARKDYSNDDDIPEYLLHQPSGPEVENMDSADTQSFYDQMMEQVAGCSLSEHDRQILEYLIGNLGDDGLLAKPLFQIADELSIYHYLDTTPEEVERVLHTLWRFDPPGVGARNLQECLIIQCKRRGYRSVPGHTPLLLKVLERNWEEISHNRWDLIQQRYKLSDQQVGLLRHEIRRLNPRPGSSMGEKTSSTETHITPDVIVSIDQDGGIELTLNEGDMPTLSVSDDAMQMIDDDFVRDCVNRGKLFIGAIKQRRHTIMRTMQAIIKLQRKYLLTGDETQLRPMRLEDIAKVTEQDLSTVSRVCNSKYVETPYGTYPLRWFFTTQARTTENEDVSVRRIHQALREVIEQEDKSAPLKDEELVGLLQQQGFDVSRRTVAKYRNQLGIPTRNMRRGVFSDNH
jgi:RNA polymerase sigma-54 factor